MVDGVDYGLIPNCNKPSLFKSGAEKLTDIFGFSKQIEVVNRIEDWDKGIFHYEVKAILISKRTGLIEAEGVGSCNSKERKYKNQDGFNIINTILKMAKKRALIDAVLSATRTSGMFTQDKEDIVDMAVNSTKKAVTLPISNVADKSQLNEVYALINELNISSEKAGIIIFERYGIKKSNQLTSKDAEDFIVFLKVYPRDIK